MPRLMASASWMLSATAAVGVMLAYAWGEGIWTGRWHPSDASKIAARRLKEIPLTIGAWEGVDSEFDERQLALGELDGYLYRIYTERTTGDQVQVLVVCGRPGPVSVHTPDVCYRGLGFTTLSPPARRDLTSSDEGPASTCWMADFQKPMLGGQEYLRIAWTWLAAERWHAADQPRVEFARESSLFKAYLIHTLPRAGAAWEDDMIPRLARELMPVLTRHLSDREPQSEEVASGRSSLSLD